MLPPCWAQSTPSTWPMVSGPWGSWACGSTLARQPLHLQRAEAWQSCKATLSSCNVHSQWQGAEVPDIADGSSASRQQG